MLVALGIVALIVIGISLFLKTSVFGELSSGARLKRLQESTAYRDGAFQNRSFTPSLKEGVSGFTVMKDFFFNRDPNNKPKSRIPSQKTDLHQLDPAENVLIWFGHSSYFIQADGKKFLIDPVLSGHAAPVSFLTRSFAGSDAYAAADIPMIDYLILTHDHFDHLDYDTIMQIKDRVGHTITGLGTGAHLERWGFSTDSYTELDWEGTLEIWDGFRFTATTARHFSGRTFRRNTSLWLSLVLKTPSFQLFLGGDSGYDTHFQAIGEKFGPFDLAILECGQYNEYWKYIHMMPEEVAQAAIDLRAQKLLPVHFGKFALSLHAWDEPIRRVTKEGTRLGIAVLTPIIGQKLLLGQQQEFAPWWENVS